MVIKVRIVDVQDGEERLLTDWVGPKGDFLDSDHVLFRWIDT